MSYFKNKFGSMFWGSQFEYLTDLQSMGFKMLVTSICTNRSNF